MTMNRKLMLSELCFAAEGLSGTAAAASLQRLGSIMEQAPTGRSFAAISTLVEISARAASALEEGSMALDDMQNDDAASKISSALAHMDTLARQSKPTPKKPRRPAARRG